MKNGVEVSCSMLRTAGKPTCIILKPDRSVLKTEFGGLSYVTVELVDAAGNICNHTNNNIYFTIYDVGSVLIVGNSNPVSEEMYVGNQRRIYEGCAMVVIRANEEPGEIFLTTTTDSTPPASVVIHVRE